ncbi:serine/threonine protein kinase [Archangium violaceum]|uniref:serine/threonine-protein kinase n=1 Tax=Archangium violaceum TaxID=83451 RepID=UPI00193C2A92|nr:serine/threonine-protein kinase [Archangium violaceum]QRK10957.1 serine/threonine protein kinase [Archangium violaceum]
MERLKETVGERTPDDRPGSPEPELDALEVLEQELERARSVLSQGESEPTRVVGSPPPLSLFSDEPQPLPRGTSVGRYLVLERLGAGGMGEVYAAFDPQLNRKVAIKLLLPGGEGRERNEARPRLMREAQAMARLSHPNVLPVFDIGEHGDRVFIALELVEGCTLRQWLKEQPRHWREVVHVLTLAGRGLAAAHAAGLVHRDFKPDNVLVGRDGRVLVYDFGLACEQGTGPPGAPVPVDLAELLRAEPPLHQDTDTGPISGLRTREPLETPVTRHGLIMGTPGYMAPEQYRQEPVTDRADQFSFCATLYYALYREHAFEGTGAGALARATLEGHVRPPPRDSRVPGWLRRVLLKGLSLHPSERHASMGVLLEALHDDPRTRRLRQALVAVAAAFLVAVVAGAVGQWHQSQSRCQGMAARLEGVWDAPRQEAVRKAFLATGAPYAADAWNGVKGALDTYASAWVEKQRQACGATRTRGQSSGELLSARTICLERRRSELKSLTGVLAEADTSVVERSVEAVRGLSELGTCDAEDALAADVPAPADATMAARVEDLRASLSRARALRISGQYAAGLSVAAPVVAEARVLGYRPLVAEALLELGQQQAGFGNPEAEHLLKEAAWTADEVRLDEVRAEALVALTQYVAYDAARVRDGHDWYQQARALLVRTRRAGRLLAELESAHGLVYAAQGDAAAAEASQHNALAALARVSSPESPEAAVVLRRLGTTLSAQGLHEEALSVYQRAHTAFLEALGAEHPRVGSSLVNIGTTLSALGRHTEALEPLRQGQAIVERSLPPYHPFHAIALDALGAALWREGKTDEALKVLHRAVEAAEQARGPEHPDAAGPSTTLGLVLVDAGRPTEALGYFERALRLRESALGVHHPELAAPLTGRGEALLKLGRAAEALAPLERALSLRETHAVPRQELAETRFALARALWASRKDTARARELAQQAERTLEQPGTESLRARVQEWLAPRMPRG